MNPNSSCKKNFGLVSVIIPTFNRESTIGRSIQSVLDQTYDSLELIIVDDGSTDRTEEIVSSISDDRIRYVKLDKNSGACVARNQGIELAKGEYIAFQDSDDAWDKNKLAKQLFMMSEKNVDICSCRIRKHYVDNSRDTYVFPSEDRCGYISHDRLCVDAFVSTQAVIAKRIVFDEERFDPKVTISQDMDWIIRASKKHDLYVDDDILVDQYWQTDSLSYTGSSKRIVETWTYWLSKYEKDFRDNPSFKLYILKNIADHSTKLGKTNAVPYYKAIFEMERNIHNLLCYLLSLLHLMPIAKRLRHGGYCRKEYSISTNRKDFRRKGLFYN